MLDSIAIFNEGITNTTPSGSTSINKVHQYITSDEPKEATLKLRELQTKEEAKTFKATSFKFATFSGTFAQRSAAGLQTFSGYLCLDIDEVSVLKEVRDTIAKDTENEPVLIFTSPSGNGLKVVYSIDPNTDPKNLGAAYDSLADHIEGNYNCIVDRAPKSVASACFLSWDPEAYFNPNASVTQVHVDGSPNPVTPGNSETNSIPTEHEFEKVVHIIDYLEAQGIKVGEEYSDWVKIAYAIGSFGEDGRALFHRLSKISGKYDSGKCEKLYSDCLQTKNGDVSLGTFFHLVKNDGVNLSEALRDFKPLAIISKAQKEFWNIDAERFYNLASENLQNESKEHPLFNQIYDDAGVKYETLISYGVGLMQYAVNGKRIEDCLVLRLPYGMKLFWFDGQWQSGDYPGSYSTDTFFGFQAAAKKEEAVVANHPFQAMFLSQVLPTADCISIVDTEAHRLGSHQKHLLSVLGNEWKKVIIIQSAKKGEQARNTENNLRSYADLLTNDQQVYWFNPETMESSDTEPFHEDLLENIVKDHSLYYFSKYIRNSHTVFNRIHYLTDSTKPRLELDLEKLPKVLKRNGVGKVYLSEDEPTVIRERDNVIEPMGSHQLFDFLKEEIIAPMSTFIDSRSGLPNERKVSRKELVQLVHNKSEKVLKDNFKAIFGKHKVHFLKDRRDSSYLFFSNTAVKVTKDRMEPIPYKKLPGKIWKSQILERAFHTKKDAQKSVMEQFLERISGSDTSKKEAFMSALGYHIHGYKDKGNTRSLILVDEDSSIGSAQGGTGKGIFAKSVKYIRKQRYIAGKNLKTDSQFMFMNAKLGDQSLFFDDVKADFDFESLFNVITDDMQIEAKYKNRITIPFEQSPKVMVSTNYIIQGFGNSFIRRQFILPFGNYFVANKPRKVFGHNLFDDWDEEEWNRFFHFMIECLQLYFNKGLVFFPTDTFKKNQLIRRTNKEFFEWAEEWLEKDHEVDLRSLFRGGEHCPGILDVDPSLNTEGEPILGFMTEHRGILKCTQARTFNEWVLNYADYKGWQVIRRESNGADLVEFK